MTMMVAGLAILGGAAIIGFVFWSGLSGGTAAGNYRCVTLLTAPADADGDAGFATESLGAQHVAPGTTISYGFCPPTSGPHYNVRGAGPLPPRFYGPNDNAGPGGWVHNLEHGFVVVLYRCADGACPEDSDLAALREFAATGQPTLSAATCGYRSKVLVARFDQMSTPFAVVAWDRALLLDGFDPAAARAFAERWIDTNAPEPNGC